jgi:hypothetical protein
MTTIHSYNYHSTHKTTNNKTPKTTNNNVQRAVYAIVSQTRMYVSTYNFFVYAIAEV